jgi:AraC-like DNA-binding protein
VDNIISITIIIEAHWYETTWAKVLFWILSIGFIAAFIHLQFFIRNLKRQRHETLEKYMALIEETTKNTKKTLYDTEAASPKPEIVKTEEQWFMDKVREYIEQNIGNSNANIDDMATAAATSRSTLNRRLNSIIGITAAQLLIDARMQHATRLIVSERNEHNSISVSDIAFRCGYTDPKYFSRCFKQKYGVAPSDYLAQ